MSFYEDDAWGDGWGDPSYLQNVQQPVQHVVQPVQPAPQIVNPSRPPKVQNVRPPKVQNVQTIQQPVQHVQQQQPYAAQFSNDAWGEDEWGAPSYMQNYSNQNTVQPPQQQQIDEVEKEISEEVAVKPVTVVQPVVQPPPEPVRQYQPVATQNNSNQNYNSGVRLQGSTKKQSWGGKSTSIVGSKKAPIVKKQPNKKRTKPPMKTSYVQPKPVQYVQPKPVQPKPQQPTSTKKNNVQKKSNKVAPEPIPSPEDMWSIIQDLRRRVAQLEAK